MAPGPRTVLYVQHASGLGGSCVSINYTIGGLDPARYRAVLALAAPAPAVEEYYRCAGIQTLAWPGIGIWNHCTAIHTPVEQGLSWLRLPGVARNWRRSEARTLELVRRVRPAIVHLNSVVLSPSARALSRAGQPFVWHIREHPLEGALDWRTAMIRRMVASYPDAVLFLSEAYRRAWVRSRRGRVVYNFIDFDQFDRRRDGAPVRQALGVPAKSPTVLFVGGLGALKGIIPLLRALALVKQRLPGLRCLAPGAAATPVDTPLLRVARRVLPLVGQGTMSQRVQRLLDQLELGETFIPLPFERDMPGMIAAADLVVFPALSPHFARPVIEAAAMARPAVASRLDGMEETLEDGASGLLVEPGDHQDLARAMIRVLEDPGLARRMGQRGHQLARERFSVAPNVGRIMDTYDSVLA